MLAPLYKCIEQLCSLPGIGKRSALRIALELLKKNSVEIQEFVSSLQNLHVNIVFCENCGALSEEKLCTICCNENRNSNLICVIEEFPDLLAIEDSKAFDGMYHILMGNISPMDGILPDDLRITELLTRIQKLSENQKSLEIFIATSPTLEGNTTANYLYDKLQSYPCKITRIAHGITTGSGIEFAQPSTLAMSIKNRASYEKDII